MSPNPNPRFQAEVADRYVIDRVLGRGGMGTVYLARDVKHGRQVAIKVLSAEAVAHVGAKRFLREVRVMARLQHPHILPLLDSGEAGGSPYYVMPYVKGGSLRDLMNNKGRLQLAEAVEITREVAGALEHAHENFLLHCDIKPENILLSAGHAVLSDFGIARVIRRGANSWRADTDGPGGTAEYISPEQATGERDLDGRSDVYSLACVLYEMLAGEPPYSGESDQAAIASRFTRPVPQLRLVSRKVPPGISRAVSRALAVDPGFRFKSVSHFIRVVEDAAVAGDAGFFGALSIRGRRALAGGRSLWLNGPALMARRMRARSHNTLEAARAVADSTTGRRLRHNGLAG
jgi:serine/threonine-protein kinase